MFTFLTEGQSSRSVLGICIVLLISSFSCGNSSTSNPSEQVSPSESTEPTETHQDSDKTGSSPELTENRSEDHDEQETDDIQPSSSISEEIEVDYSLGPIEIGFNARYLLDIAQQIEGTMAQFVMADSGSPTIVRDTDDPTSLYVLMPMRV